MRLSAERLVAKSRHRSFQNDQNKNQLAELVPFCACRLGGRYARGRRAIEVDTRQRQDAATASPAAPYTASGCFELLLALNHFFRSQSAKITTIKKNTSTIVTPETPKSLNVMPPGPVTSSLERSPVVDFARMLAI